GARDQFVLNPLTIVLPMVVLDVLGTRPPEMAFAKRDHTIETLFLDRAHEPFSVGIRIRRLIRRLHHARASAQAPSKHRFFMTHSVAIRGPHEVSLALGPSRLHATRCYLETFDAAMARIDGVCGAAADGR